MSSYSSNASKIIESFEKSNIEFVKEIIEHDGYDEYGPESNLYTLYIITKESNKTFTVYRYYYEYWYGSFQNDYSYSLEVKSNINNITLYDLSKLKSFLNEIKDKNKDLFDVLNMKYM